jgi:hypothetical protein
MPQRVLGEGIESRDCWNDVASLVFSIQQSIVSLLLGSLLEQAQAGQPKSVASPAAQGPNFRGCRSVSKLPAQHLSATLGRRHAFVLGNALTKYHRSRRGLEFGMSPKCGLCRCDSRWYVARLLTDELEQL